MFMIVDYTDTKSAAQVDTDIPLATDSMITSVNSHPLFPVPVYIQWWYGAGATMTRVRLSAPRVKPISRPVLCPVDPNASPSDPLKILNYYSHPLLLNPVEEIQMLRSHTGTSAEQNHVVLCVGDNVRTVPQADLYVVRGTTSFTPTANTWSTGTITLDDTLQAGRYSIIGMRVNSATLVAGRLIFPGAPISGGLPQIRPGTIARASDGVTDHELSRFGRMGEYGQFESFALPVLEVMDTATTANPEVIFDIVNVRVGARTQ